MESIISGLTPFDPSQLVQVSMDELRSMDLASLVAFAHQLGVPVNQVAAERGRLLTEVLQFAVDA